MSHEEFTIPKYADELIDGIDSAHDKRDAEIHAEAQAILGSEFDMKSARGRVKLLADSIRTAPGKNYNVDIPLVSLRTEKDSPLPDYERMRAMAVNEQVLNALYEEAGVDYLKRKVHDAPISGHISREITYLTDKGYAFIETQGFDYKADPQNSVPTQVHLEVYTLRDGQPRGGESLMPRAVQGDIKI